MSGYQLLNNDLVPAGGPYMIQGHRHTNHRHKIIFCKLGELVNDVMIQYKIFYQRMSITYNVYDAILEYHVKCNMWNWRKIEFPINCECIV
jgi:hypothetical protein